MRRRLAGILIALLLAGCAARGGRVAAPSPAPPTPSSSAVEASPGSASAAAPPAAAPALPRASGAVAAPWDTAARSAATRRAHVYPRGASALGERLVASLPDPGGLAPAEGDAPAPAPLPVSSSTGEAPAPGCWEAQLLVTSDAARAERARAEAAALLGVEARVESRDGSFRVRAGGCIDSEAARRLVERARAESWPEAFRVLVSR